MKSTIFTKIFISRILPEVLSKACGATIPRSGDAGELVDCYSVQIQKDRKPHLLIRKIENGQITCLQWDGNSYAIEKIVTLSNVNWSHCHITHFYKLYDINYSDIHRFVVDWYTNRRVYCINVKLIVRNVRIRLFRKRELITRTRMELLSIVAERQFKGESISSFSIMNDLNSTMWIHHHQGEITRARLELFLDSFVDSQDLEKCHANYYKIKPKALRTIEEYEQIERRHKENVQTQNRIVLLTFVLAALALVQSGIIKCPTILDLSNLFQ